MLRWVFKEPHLIKVIQYITFRVDVYMHVLTIGFSSGNDPINICQLTAFFSLLLIIHSSTTSISDLFHFNLVKFQKPCDSCILVCHMFYRFKTHVERFIVNFTNFTGFLQVNK